ncbi:hypothetical protein [uncultured Clostridium sp.]|uniref:hypothetical protein n=1 Tax=uncultured Clostridium sp. TaxID=59620 RepID=UPI0026212290|nr:hypothetical protein [uncultured Clostridium sp.]
MKKNNIDLVCCKNCKFYRYEKINDYSEMWSCTKGNTVSVTGYDTRENKYCYQQKPFKFKKKVKKDK